MGCTDVVGTDDDSVDAPDSVYASTDQTSFVLISWRSSTGSVSSSTTYDLYRSTSANGEFSKIATNLKYTAYYDSYSSSNLKYGQVYYYKVRTVKDGDYSGFSPTAYGYLGLSTVSSSSLSASQGDYESVVKLKWSISSSSDLNSYTPADFFYRIFYANGEVPTLESAYIDLQDISNTEASISSLQPNINYHFAVQVISKNHTFISSALSDDVTGYVKTPSPDTVWASKGTNSDTIFVRWTAIKGVMAYKIYGTCSTDEYITTVSYGSAAFANRQLSHVPSYKGVTYTYDVRSVVGSGVSEAKTRTLKNSDSLLLNIGYCGLNMPGNVTAKYQSPSLIVSWDAVENVGHYEVLYGVKVEGTIPVYDTIKNLLVTSYIFDKTNLIPGYTYVFKIRACRKIDETHNVYSENAIAEGSLPIRVPENLSATKSEDTLRITWDVEEGITKCILRYSTLTKYNNQDVNNKEGAFSDLATVTSASSSFAFVHTASTDASFEKGVKYCYAVKAVAGTTVSGHSAIDSGWSRVGSPENFKVTAVTDTSISLEWKRATAANTYYLYRDNWTTPIETIVVTDGKETVPYTDNGLTSGTTYKYQVRAVSSYAGISEPSALDTTTTILPPTNVTATRDSLGYVKLTWNVNSQNDLLNFKVYRYAYGLTRDSAEEVTQISYPNTSVSDLLGVPGKVYNYFVTACLATIGESSISNTAVGFSKLPAPTNFEVSKGKYSEKIVLSWLGAFSRGAEKYTIYRGVLDSTKAVKIAPESLATVSCSTDGIMEYGDSKSLKNQEYYTYYLQANRTDYSLFGGQGKVSTIDTGYISIAPITMISASLGDDTAMITVRFEKNPSAKEYWFYYREDTLHEFQPLNFKNSKTSNAISSDDAISTSSTSNEVTYTFNVTDSADINKGSFLILAMKAYNSDQLNVATADGASALSNQVPSYLKFLPPFNCEATKGGKTNVKVTWSPSYAKELDGYEIWRKKRNVITDAFVKIYSVNSLEYLDSPEKGVMYSYKVRSYSESLQNKIKALTGTDPGLIASDYTSVDSGFVCLSEITDFTVTGNEGTALEDSIVVSVALVGVDAKYSFRQRVKGSSDPFIDIPLNNAGEVSGRYRGSWAAPDRQQYEIYAIASSGHKKDDNTEDVQVSDTLVGFRSPEPVDSVEASKFVYDDTIMVTWKNKNGATSYDVTRKTVGSTDSIFVSNVVLGEFTTSYDLIDDGSGNITFIDRVVEEGNAYVYYVKANCPGGNEVGYSKLKNNNDSVRATGYALFSEIDNVNASDGVSYKYVSVVWDSVPFADSYAVYRILNSASITDKKNIGTYTPVGVFDSLGCFDIPVDTNYYLYRVQPIKWLNGSRFVATMNKGSFTNVPVGWRALTPPTIASVTTDSVDVIVVKWNVYNNAVSYTLYRHEEGSNDTIIIAPSLLSTTISYRDIIDKADAGKGYYYYVKATTSHNNRVTALSEKFNAGSAKLYPVSLLKLTALNTEGKVEIYWEAADNTDSVRIVYDAATFSDMQTFPGTVQKWKTTLAEGEFGKATVTSICKYNESIEVSDSTFSELLPLTINSYSRGMTDTIQISVKPNRPPLLINIFRYSNYLDCRDDVNSEEISFSVAGDPTTANTQKWVQLGNAYLLNDTSSVLKKGMRYFYRAKYTISGGSSYWSPLTICDNNSYGWCNPETPVLIDATRDSLGYVLVNWHKVSYGDGYRVARSWVEGAEQKRDTLVVSNMCDDTVYSDNDIIPGKFYTYSVQAFVQMESAYSKFSNTDSGYARLVPPEIDVTKGSLSDTISLSWNVERGITAPGSGAEEFVVKRGQTTNSLVIIDTIIVNSQTNIVYNDTLGLKTGFEIYYYRVYSVAGSLQSAESNLDSGWVKLLPCYNIKASDGAYVDSVIVSWSVPVSTNKDQIVYSIYRNGDRIALETGDTCYRDESFTSSTKGIAHVYTVSYHHPLYGSSARSVGDTGYTRLDRPEVPSASDNDDNIRGIKVFSSTVENADSVYVCRKGTVSGTTSIDTVYRFNGDANASFIDEEGVFSGILYEYYSVAWNELTGFSDTSYHDTGRAVLFPPDLTVSKEEYYDTIKITWKDYAQKSFDVFRDTVTNGTRARINSSSISNSGEYIDTAISAGRVYYYWVKATANSQTKTSEMEHGYLKLSKPKLLVCSRGTLVDTIRLGWFGLEKIERYGFRKYLANGGDTSYFEVKKSECIQIGDTLIYYDKSLLSKDASYCYEFNYRFSEESLGLDVTSEYSDVDTGWKKPACPENFSVSKGLNADTIQVSWSASGFTSDDSVLVYRASTISGLPNTCIGTVIGTSGKYIDDNASLSKGTYYYYQIRKKTKAFGYSKYSDVDSGYLLLSAPSNFFCN